MGRHRDIIWGLGGPKEVSCRLNLPPHPHRIEVDLGDPKSRVANGRRVGVTSPTEYLLVVYVAAERRQEPVSTGHVAEVVGRSPSATTEAFDRLADRGLVRVEPYEGVRLTDDGEAAAAEAYETFTTLARFFRTVLRLPDAEREALAAVDTVDAVVAERIAARLLSDAEPPDPARDPPTVLVEPPE